MKLYATVSSERATKGQGGNKYLDIKIYVGTAKNPYLLSELRVEHKESIVEPMGTSQSLDGFIVTRDGKIIDYILDDSERLKGEKQKSEVCSMCGMSPCADYC